MKQYIGYICITGVTALLLSACGGGGGSSSSDGKNKPSNNNGNTAISLAGTDCISTPSSTDIDGYITLLSNDTLIKDSANTKVEIYHNVNGSKKVCLVSGLAHIQRL